MACLFPALSGCWHSGDAPGNLYAADQQQELTPDDISAIHFLVFRHLLPDAKAADTLSKIADGEVWFLAIADHQENEHNDVPSALTERLQGESSVTIKPISASRATPPSEQGIDEPNYRDRETNKKGRLFFVSAPRKVDSTSVELNAGERTAPLVSHLATYILRKSEGRWRIVNSKGQWRS